jgi:tRNA-splicing ligase RtcB
MNLTIFGEHEQKVVDQLERCVAQEEGSLGVLCADGHLGYSAPIGGVVAYRNHVSPAAVGYDIGCGNLAVATNLIADVTFRSALPGLMDRVFAEVSFGMGRNDGVITDHPVFDRIAHADFEPQRDLLDLARRQLGTVGAGNHYVDVFADETGRVWVGVHFGSRGFGHKTASGFLAMAKGLPFTARAPEGEMAAPPDVLPVDGEMGAAYLAAMQLAGEYAYAGRDVVVNQVLGILGAQAVGEAIHNHHNYAWREQHRREWFYVVRKGATPAFPGQKGFVGATMGEPAVILEGLPDANALQAAALYSTVHGAGRAMSRTAAAGKSRKRWSCPNRDCGWVQQPGQPGLPAGASAHQTPCPGGCGHVGLTRRWVRETEGAIDWAATTADLEAKQIELRGANAEEAPGAYKRLDEVLAAHAGTVRILHTLAPLGVAMAPGDTDDPFKD